MLAPKPPVAITTAPASTVILRPKFSAITPFDPAVSLDEIGHLGIRHHFDSAVGFADHLLKRANVGVARRSGRIVAALPKGTRGRTDLILKLDAEVFGANRPNSWSFR